MYALWAELGHGWRTLKREPAGSVLIVCILAFGLACVIAILSIIKTMVWNPLPFPAADRVQRVGWINPLQNSEEPQPISGVDFLQWQKLVADSATMAAAQQATVNLADQLSVARYDGAYVTANTFGMLGIAPKLGRDFSSSDDQPGAPLTVMLSESLWRTRFAADPTMIGRSFRANGETATVIGVMPARFSFPIREQIWLPARLDAAANNNNDRELMVFMAPVGNAPDAAALTPLRHWLIEHAKAAPEWVNREIHAESLSHYYTSPETRSILALMLATVALVLLVACANVAHLMLVRTLSRSRDFLVRLTLGATRIRIAAQLLGQSLALTAIALLVALPLAQFGVLAILDGFSGTDEGPPPWMQFGVDDTMVAISFALAVITAISVALLPVLRIRMDALGDGLRDGGRNVIGAGAANLSRWLVAAELAMACIVLLATLVMVRAVDGMARADLGINSERLLTARVALFPAQFPTDSLSERFIDELTAALRADPAVDAAGAGTALPGLSSDAERMAPAGFDAAGREFPLIRSASVDTHYLDAFGIELRAGRNFSAADRADSEPVVIIDERFARTLFPTVDPIGQRVRIPADDVDGRWHTVVGVVETLQMEDAGDPELPAALVALTQHPRRFVSIVVRTHADPALFKPRFSEILRSQDPDTPAYWLRTYDEVLAVAMAGERVLSSAFAVFGLIALTLAAAGLYGLVAQLVSQRSREIGVQRALGATASAVLGTLLSRLSLPLTCGLLMGSALAVGFVQLMTLAMPAVRVDAYSLLGLIAVLTIVALVATWIPARRALRVDPTVALRHD